MNSAQGVGTENTPEARGMSPWPHLGNFWHDARIVHRKLRQEHLSGNDRVGLALLRRSIEDAAKFWGDRALGKAHCRLAAEMDCYRRAHNLDWHFRLQDSGLSDDELDTLFG